MYEPFGDNEMTFNKTKNQYILTIDSIMNNLFLDEHITTELKTSKRFNALAIETSDDIYDFIYANTKRSSVDRLEAMLAYKEEWRETLKWAMLYQMRYTLRSGGSLIKDQHGIDIERSKRLDRSDVRSFDHIAPASERLLKRKIIYTGDFR